MSAKGTEVIVTDPTSPYYGLTGITTGETPVSFPYGAGKILGQAVGFQAWQVTPLSREAECDDGE